MVASYATGSWLAFVTTDLCLLVDTELDESIVSTWWQLLGDGEASLERVVGLLVEEGFGTVQSFALVGFSDGGGAATTPSVLVRGEASVTMVTHSGEIDSIDAAGAATWHERRVPPNVVTLVLDSQRDQPPPKHLPLRSGAVMASQLRVELRSDQFVAADGPILVEEPDGARSRRGRQATASSATQLESSEPPVASVADVVQVAEPPVRETEVAAFDHLFGATQRPTDLAATVADLKGSKAVDDATLSPGDTDHPSEADIVDSGVAPTPVAAADPEDAPSRPNSIDVEGAPDGPGIISALPWELGSGQDGTRVSEAEPTYEDATISRSALHAGYQASAPAASSGPGPTVHAVECDRGHLSPAHASSCRVCSCSLSSQEAFTAPRPVLGVLKLSTGDVVSLDRDVLMGREPTVPSNGGVDRPHVVKLRSPDNDISRTHLEIRLDGWHVLVVDLGSLNGTVVERPNEEPLRLRANDPVAIEPGTIVHLAEEVSFQFEVLA